MNRTPVPEHLREDAAAGTPGFIPPTDKQISYLEGLRDGKDLTTLTPEQRAWLDDADFSKIPKLRASDIITKLKELPWKPREMDSSIFKEMWEIEVDTGRYAIPGEDGKLRFYSVKRDGERMALWVDVWASDARYPIRAIPQRIEILKEIAKDPIAAMKTFGNEIGKCGRCGRTLTDETSRAFGIGPDCRDILGL
jgi:Family of unknown function (DUF6011)